MKIVVTGAAGFVGAAFVKKVIQDTDWEVIGLSRSNREDTPEMQWRQADLFSLRETRNALEGADVAVYLVHSMLPAARLSQGSFSDWDAILADNFARSARRCGVKAILYLGGIVPDGKLSPHLASRKEVEGILSSQGVPVTTLRAGMVVGPGGSSFVLVSRLVRRLPVMLCPSWTRTPTQPVDVDDLVHAMQLCLEDKSRWGKTYDIGAAEPTTYLEMMRTVAWVAKVKRWFISVPLFSPGLSRLWVSLITGAPRALVSPLIKSLRHPMVVSEKRAFRDVNWFPRPFEKSAQEHYRPKTSAPRAFRPSGSTSVVQSVQRLPLPPGWDAARVAATYMEWLPRLGFVRVRRGGDVCSIGFPFLSRPLLVLAWDPEYSRPDRHLLRIRGGLLARDTGKGFLEFRQTACGKSVLAAIHRFRPRLPWYVYRFTQAWLHLLVMKAFGRFLGRQG